MAFWRLLSVRSARVAMACFARARRNSCPCTATLPVSSSRIRRRLCREVSFVASRDEGCFFFGGGGGGGWGGGGGGGGGVGVGGGGGVWGGGVAS